MRGGWGLGGEEDEGKSREGLSKSRNSGKTKRGKVQSISC